MPRAEERTCGKGLAENSVLPARLANLLSAMAENLEVHQKALDLTDPHSRVEHEAYGELIGQLQQVARQLDTTANQMAGYRDLVMGKHDMQAMTHPRVLEAFEKLVKQKQELLSLLAQTTERDSKLLEMMRSQSRTL